jgi:hypothetical protein
MGEAVPDSGWLAAPVPLTPSACSTWNGGAPRGPSIGSFHVEQLGRDLLPPQIEVSKFRFRCAVYIEVELRVAIRDEAIAPLEGVRRKIS